MCGIAGIVYEDPARPVSRAALERMCRALGHRGPDGEGIWIGSGVGLAHRRLAVIDLSPAGRQPMSNEDESLWITYNGEIYNFLELRRQLADAGHRFRSRTDTEVILHLFEEKGERCVRDLHGMFALAIWDDRTRRLFLARDRVGKKPLKYAVFDGGLIFASELKAILASGLVDTEPDLAAIDMFFELGYVPGPATGSRAIRKLLPAQTLTWSPRGLQRRDYWHLDFGEKRPRSMADCCETLREIVTRCVKRRLVSDVPLGAFLSGGIDSSVVVACMAQTSDRPVRTFSMGFEHEPYNELPYARMVAQRFATVHHEFIVRADAVDLLPELAFLYEEPYADSSALPSYLLARETRRFVTVALNGDGGDEAFGGYTRYARLLRWRRVLSWGRRVGLHRLASALQRYTRPRSRFGELADKLVALASDSMASQYAWLVRLFSERQRHELYGPALREIAADRARRNFQAILDDPASGSTALDRMQSLDIRSYLPDDLLVKMDLATMAHGLEARSPLLDPEVLEFAASLPSATRYRAKTLKWLLREAFRSVLPESLLSRGKQGFAVPLAEWFRGPWRTFFQETVLGPRSRNREFLDSGIVSAMFADHVAGRAEHGRRLWALLMFELWLERTSGKHGASEPEAARVRLTD